ncbi:MAG: BMC domain-containing protein [Melioribacteraceae bacterium]|nr:BMC domain-containing protein [Melioribacteraceae bacterium]
MINKNSIGLIELSSIASGMLASDTMLKTSEVELILSRSICSGKYMVLIGGDVAAVQAAVTSAEEIVRGSVIDTFVIPNVHPDIFPAISGQNEVDELKALGILEAFSVASLIEGADAAAKSSNIKLIEVRLAMALGGKAYCTLTGDVAAVTSAIDSGALVIAEKGMLVNKLVIANPRKELLSEKL